MAKSNAKTVPAYSKKAVANLRRRVLRFNASNAGLAIDLNPVTTYQEYRNLYLKLGRRQNKVKENKRKERARIRLNVSKNKKILEAEMVGIKVSPEAAKAIDSPEKLKELTKKVGNAKRKITLSTSRLIKQQKEFDDINRALSKTEKDWHNKMVMTAIDNEESKLLTKVKKAYLKKDYDEVRKLLKVPDGVSIYDHTSEIAAQRRYRKEAYLPGDIRYYYTALEWLPSSAVPELKYLFESLGIGGMMALAQTEFKISAFIDSKGLNKQYSREWVLQALEDVLDELPANVRRKCEIFLERYK